MTDGNGGEKHDVWKLEITGADGRIESRELTVSSSPEGPFNQDGFWKAVFHGPDGELRWLPLVALVCPPVEGQPQFFVWVNDSVVDCDTLPGFVGVIGTELDMDEELRHPCDEWIERIASWKDFYERERTRSDAPLV